MERIRCEWAGSDPLYVQYHDTEWGRPVHDERTWFEFLTLEGAQAGLSWITILRKRAAYRQAFANFEPQAVAAFGEADAARLMNDAGIVRNRLKIRSAIQNAQAFLKVQAAFGSFDAYMWQFVDGHPLVNSWRSLAEIPAKTPLAERMSKDLRQRGFNFVGPTICYAHIQATGLVNDHVVGCFCYAEIAALALGTGRS